METVEQKAQEAQTDAAMLESMSIALRHGLPFSFDNEDMADLLMQAANRVRPTPKTASDASAGLVAVPVEDLARLSDAAGKWGKHLRAELHRDAADNIAQSCDTADAILRAAQGESDDG